jgi:hypothetical protein
LIGIGDTMKKLFVALLGALLATASPALADVYAGPTTLSAAGTLVLGVTNSGSVIVTAVGSPSGASFTIQGSSDQASLPPAQANWTALPALPVGGGPAVTSMSAAGKWCVNAAAMTRVEVNLSSITGSLTFTMQAGPASCVMSLSSALPIRGFKAGFTLSLDPTTPTTVIDVGNPLYQSGVSGGQAADSTDTVILSNPVSGSVNLATSGAGGLDTGAVGATTWYALFEIYGSAGYSAIASAPAVIATTGAVAASSTTLGTAGGTNITAGSNITVAGAGPGATTLRTSVVGAPTSVSVTPTGTTTNSSNSITAVSSLASVIPGLSITDSDNCLQSGTVITAASGSTITLSQNAKASGCGAGDTLTITGDAVTLANAAVTTVNATFGGNAGCGTTVNCPTPVWGVSSISGRPPMSPLLPTGYSNYRYIGEVLTDGSSHLVPWAQYGEEFVWVTPVADCNTCSITSTKVLMKSFTVPIGVRVSPILNVKAAGGTGVLVQSPDAGPEIAGAINGLFDALASGIDMYDRVTESRTNVAGQLMLSSNSGTSTAIATRGWEDNFGSQN